MSSSRRFALEIVQRLRSAGYEALWAGGCVRDSLLGKTPKDFDVATNATPDEIRELFGRRRTLAIGAAFGVITVLGRTRQIAPVEVATFRQDATYSDGRHPDSVTFSSAREDALRRDFTINGLFFDPIEEQVIDYVGGQQDLQQRIIRAIGDPHQRFAEDKLRMLRGVRLAAAMGFQIDRGTLDAIAQHADELTQVSPERIAAELRRMLIDDNRRIAVELLRQARLLAAIVPDWQPSPEDWIQTLDILTALREPTFNVSLAALLRAACLATDQPLEHARKLCRNLRLSGDDTQGVALLLERESVIRQARRVPWPQLQRILVGERIEELLDYSAAVAQVLDQDLADIDYCRAKRRLPAQQLDPPPLITGDDLIQAGIAPGPQFRPLLDRIRDEQLEGRLTDSDQALELAKRLAANAENDRDCGGDTMELFAQLERLLMVDDHAAVAHLLRQHPELRQHLSRKEDDCRMPLLAAAKTRAMVDVLIDNGARVEDVTKWWQSGFGARQVIPDVAGYLVHRGAMLSIHAATAIGLVDVVRQLLDHQPELVCAKGGDGCHPLHFCSDPEIAQLLIAHGANIDARDEDHDSTPVQWQIGDSPDVVRYLLNEGATADVFLAAALGDLELTRRLVADDPSCTAYRIGNNRGPFPGIGFQGRGGTIYQWTLGFNLSPHEVALKRGHTAIYDFLIQHTMPKAKLLVACTSANRPLADQIVAENPDIIGQLDEEDRALLPKFCWETNKSIDAVRLMLDLGFPVDAPERNHGFTALHNAAWCGDPDLVRLLLDRGHPPDLRDPDHDSTAIGWAIHSCIEAKRHPEGKFAEVVGLLLDAGTSFDPQHYPVGHEAIDRVIKDHLETFGP